MTKWMLLMAGGVLGTLGRYALAGVVYRWCGEGFPYGTLAVNTLGCLVIGALSALADQKFLLSPEARLFAMVGLLGAFTTFSSLIYESVRLLQSGQGGLACANLFGSLLLGLAAFWAGQTIAILL